MVWSPWRPKAKRCPPGAGAHRAVWLRGAAVTASMAPPAMGTAQAPCWDWASIHHPSHGAQAPRLLRREKGLCTSLRRKRRLWCGKSSSQVLTLESTAGKKNPRKNSFKAQGDGTISAGAPQKLPHEGTPGASSICRLAGHVR